MPKSPNTPSGASSEKLQETHRHKAKDRAFSDYVVYVDESGDHSLTSINPDFPIFVLAFCVFHKRHYSEMIIPAVEKLKFNYFGHDSVVLHENEIRRQKGPFTFLSQRTVRQEFMGQLDGIIVVDCSQARQLSRVMARNGWTQAQTQAVMDTQASRQERLSVANWVIDNDSDDLSALQKQADAWEPI